MTQRPNGSEQRLSAGLWALGVAWPASRAGLLGVIVCTLVRGLVPAGFALAIRGLINAATAAAGRPDADFAPLLTWLLAALAVTLLDAAATLLQQFFAERLRGDLSLSLNSRVLRHASALDLPYFEHAGHREIIEHIQRDPGSKLHQFLMESQKAALSGFQVLSLLLLLVWLEPLILPVAALLAVPFLLFQWRLARTRFQVEQQRTVKRRWTRWFLQRLTAPETIGEVKLLGIGGLLTARFAATLRDQDRRLQLRQFAGSGLFVLLATLAFFGLFARIAHQVLAGALTVGDLAIFGGAVVRLRTALDSGIRAAAAAYEQGLFMDMLREFLRARPLVRDRDAAVRVGGGRRGGEMGGDLDRGFDFDADFDIDSNTDSETQGDGEAPIGSEIVVAGVGFGYPGGGGRVLHDISFEVAAGETVAIVGENGSGKSTLAKLLVRLYDPDAGVIRLDGRPLADWPLRALHRDVSLMGQGYGRYEASMAENIAYGDWGRLRDDRAAVERLAELTGVAHIANALPAGLDTPLGREFGAHDLSGGQWQRLAITRALARPARLLILDEPTSNIDARAEHDLFAAIAEAARGRTTILISHRFSTLRMADRILVLHHGRLVEQGTHAGLLAAGGHYATLYRLHEHYRLSTAQVAPDPQDQPASADAGPAPGATPPAAGVDP
ncbi:ABC transporter ATP-binding protein [uncultured Thiohalocapsa sp.]|uniref:ABC transporter ATP-binding protein n=1 Tax=uncultured Thiohalocapsa sp. TaxID=768990 RepID=UPI0025F34204|nr:ABC transporter ATP-binding protein [uncultured Thiohalocapsa sp.]